jgi:hypothetical protein
MPVQLKFRNFRDLRNNLSHPVLVAYVEYPKFSVISDIHQAIEVTQGFFRK